MNCKNFRNYMYIEWIVIFNIQKIKNNIDSIKRALMDKSEKLKLLKEIESQDKTNYENYIKVNE